MQPARPQLDVLESFAIRAERAVVVDAARHVRPVALQNFPVGGLLEIENVEGAGRAGDDVGGFLHALSEAGLLEERGDSPERCDIGARCQEFDEFTTGG